MIIAHSMCVVVAMLAWVGIFDKWKTAADRPQRVVIFLVNFTAAGLSTHHAPTRFWFLSPPKWHFFLTEIDLLTHAHRCSCPVIECGPASLAAVHSFVFKKWKILMFFLVQLFKSNFSQEEADKIHACGLAVFLPVSLNRYIYCSCWLPFFQVSFLIKLCHFPTIEIQSTTAKNDSTLVHDQE